MLRLYPTTGPTWRLKMTFADRLFEKLPIFDPAWPAPLREQWLRWVGALAGLPAGAFSPPDRFGAYEARMTAALSA